MALVRSLVSALVEDQVRSLVGFEEFDPASLFANGEQGAWYDPSDLTTLYQDSAGTTPVAADGDPVGLMLDKSGNGNHASQATSASRPVYRTDGALHWLKFDGVDDSLSTSAIDFTATDEVSVATSQESIINEIRILCELSEDTNSNDGSWLNYISTDKYLFNSKGTKFSAGTAANTASVASPDKCVLFSTGKISTINTIRRNGVDGIDGVFGAKGTGNFGNHPLYIGARGGGSLFFSGSMFGLLALNRLSSEKEVLSVEALLAQKAGVTL